MTSRIHKMLVDLIIRKMSEKGYTIVASEGKLLASPEYERTPIPLKIKRHRPDVIGIDIISKKLCIGEAKTADDLFSKRTANQFSDFGNIIGRTSGEQAELIIGVPLRSKETLLHILKKINLPTDKISIIVLPEELAENESQDFI